MPVYEYKEPPYTLGKLYRVKDYSWSTIGIYTEEGVLDPSWGGRARVLLFSRDVDEVVFLYLGYIYDTGNTIPLLRVLCDDTVGTVDAKVELEELLETNDAPNSRPTERRQTLRNAL